MVVHYVLVSMYFQIEFDTSIQEMLFITKNRENGVDNTFTVNIQWVEKLSAHMFIVSFFFL